MKQFVALLLAILMLFGLAACDSDTAKKSEKDKASSQENEDDEHEEKDDADESTTAPQQTQPEGLVFSAEEAITVEDVLSVTVVNFYTAKDVKPPKPATFYTHFEASDGNTYWVVVMDVKHLGTESVMANTLLVPVVSVDDKDYTPFVLVEENEGAELSRGSSTTVVPLQSVRLYLLYTVPENVSAEAVTLSATIGDVSCTGQFTREEFESRIPILSAGDVIGDEKTISATLESVAFTDAVYPPNPTGYYHYYPAGDGNVYLVVKMTVKNLKETEIAYDAIAGISCSYKEKYHYSFSTVFEDNEGGDLNGYPGQHAIAPLDEGVVYYLAEMPEEVQEGPVEITLYIAGSYYKILL